MMIINLEGKRALVGASTDGLGKAIAIKLAKAGCSVTLAARNEEKLKKILSQLDISLQQQHQYLVLNYNDNENTKSIYQAYFQHNSVDLLINNTNGPATGDVLLQTSVMLIV